VIKALNGGKHVFVEKPLCLSVEELEKITSTYIAKNKENGTGIKLMVGFNRRFAPHISKIKELLQHNRRLTNSIATLPHFRVKKSPSKKMIKRHSISMTIFTKHFSENTKNKIDSKKFSTMDFITVFRLRHCTLWCLKN
jgi:hypothetical protein